MSEVITRLAGKDDAERLNAALRQLSRELGDEHLASDEDVARAGFGESPSFSAFLAELDGEIVGVALCSAFFSTTRGAAGVFVSDLWVVEAQRGSGVARRLLAAVCDHAAREWEAAFMRLNVYHHNSSAVAAYERLGLATDHHEKVMTLGIDNFDRLRTLK